MRIRVDDPALLPELLEFLRSRMDAVAEPLTDGEAEVTLLGSYGEDAMRMTLYLLVRAWEAGRGSRRAAVEIVD